MYVCMYVQASPNRPNGILWSANWVKYKTDDRKMMT